MDNSIQLKNKQGIARLIEIAGSKKWLLFISMTFAVAATLLQYVPYLAVYKILGALAQYVDNPTAIDQSFIYYWAYISLVSFIAYGGLLFISIMFSHVAAFNILYELRVQIAKKLIHLPMGFFTQKSSGEIKKIMNEDVERIELFIAHHIPDIISAIIVPLLLITYMFFIEWRLALVTLVLFIVIMLLFLKIMMNNKTQQLYAEYANSLGKMNASIIEYIRGIQVVKTFTQSTQAYRQLNSDINEFHDFSVGVSKTYLNIFTLLNILLSSAILFIAPVGIWLLTQSISYQAYVPKLLLFLVFSISILFPILKLMFVTGFMNQNKTGVAIIDDVLNKPEIIDRQQKVELSDSSIEFNQVGFSYDGETQVLNNISFTAKPNTITALVGPSGAGKTTIALLAARFWDIQQGEIKIGTVPIKQIAVEQLMDNIAFVFQDNLLFFDTIEENIRMGNKQASFDEVVVAAKMAQCHEFIEQLADGYQTLVGEGGTYLSGGEAQRIALARVALKNSPIILLDEATAFADPENEHKILHAFAKITHGKTVLVIAHRLGTITNAEQILYIDKGMILEQGTHTQLLAQQGAYASMWQTYIASKDWVLER